MAPVRWAKTHRWREDPRAGFGLAASQILHEGALKSASLHGNAEAGNR